MAKTVSALEPVFLEFPVQRPLADSESLGRFSTVSLRFAQRHAHLVGIGDGRLHIGHCKAIALNFGVADEFDSRSAVSGDLDRDGRVDLVVVDVVTTVDVVVDEIARGRGVGELLTNAAIDRARAAGAKSVGLTSRPAREAANRLYSRMGFEVRDTNVYRLTL